MKKISDNIKLLRTYEKTKKIIKKKYNLEIGLWLFH